MNTNNRLRFPFTSPRLWLAFSLCFLGAALAGFVWAAGSGRWAEIASPNVNDSSSNDLEDVTCVSASDCWAVGTFGPNDGPLRTLVQHWDGASWSIVPSPNVVATGNNQHNRLLDVACSSASDCWAVGTFRDQEIDRTLILRWNGSSWSIVPSPNASSKGNFLVSVTCTSGNDCWAVGQYEYDIAALNGAYATLIQQWNGTAWSIVPSPNYSSGNPASPVSNSLFAVTCTSASDCFAVGGYREFLQPSRTLIARWDGAMWSLVPSPNSAPQDYNGLASVACASPSNCWAVGSYLPENDPEHPRTFIARWNGTEWAAVPAAEQGRSGSLQDVTCPAASECWAVGRHIERWDGNSWSVFPAPEFATSGVTCSSSAECWAVGRRNAAGSFKSLILRYSSAAGTAPAQLQNISTRLRVQAGENVLIGGFIVTGSAPKKVILRAIGPTLSSGGSPTAGRLLDPTLELNDNTGARVAFNDNWKDSPERSAVEASGIPPSDDREAAIVRVLSPGSYTATVRGANESTGIALVEVYDVDAPADSRLANISTRGFVETGDNVMIGGLIVGPSDRASTKMLVRAVGPTLAAQGVAGALQDPTIALHDANGTLLAANDNWKESQRGEIEGTGIPPTDDRESAIVRVLAPGLYTAIARGRADTTGVALIEAYNLGSP